MQESLDGVVGLGSMADNIWTHHLLVPGLIFVVVVVIVEILQVAYVCVCVNVQSVSLNMSEINKICQPGLKHVQNFIYF